MRRTEATDECLIETLLPDVVLYLMRIKMIAATVFLRSDVAAIGMYSSLADSGGSRILERGVPVWD